MTIFSSPGLSATLSERGTIRHTIRLKLQAFKELSSRPGRWLRKQEVATPCYRYTHTSLVIGNFWRE